MTIYIVAGSTQEYERWLVQYSQDVAQGLRKEHPVRLLRNAAQIRTLDKSDYVRLLKCWRSRPDWRDIYNALIATGRRTS